IAQAWAVLSGAAPEARQRQAMAALEAHLVEREAGLLHLLAPPLAEAQPSAGYIQAYPPGVRENGGQYSHAGVWALMARAARSDGEVPPAPAGMRELAPGDRLRWSTLPPESSCRIVLAPPAQRVGGASARADAPVG